METEGSCIAVFKKKEKIKRALDVLKSRHLGRNNIFVVGEGFYEENLPQDMIAEGLEEDSPVTGLSEFGNFLNYYAKVPYRFIVKYEQMLREHFYFLIVTKIQNVEKVKDLLKKSKPLDVMIHIG